MKKLGFVTSWYGDTIPGGAEIELRGLVKHLQAANVELEVLTTCVEQFVSDWNVDYYEPGLSEVGGIAVRRFRVRKRDTQKFDEINIKLMRNEPISKAEEQTFIREMINSPDLIQYIERHQNEYALFVAIPYMFGPVYYTALSCPTKTVLIPCFHNESYFFLDIYKKAFSKIVGISYLAQPEMELANQYYDLSHVQQKVLGAGVDTEYTGNAERFREKYGISEPFLLYAGRKDVGKNIYTLLRYFERFKKDNPSNLKLVLIGGGEIHIPKDLCGEVLDLGFVDVQNKFDAYTASLALCQPSVHESFSIVIMESWLSRRPVLVHRDCAVTKNFVSTANGGLYFGSYWEFSGCLKYFLSHPEQANIMGQNGYSYVMGNFSWDVVVDRYKKFFAELVSPQTEK